MAMPSLISSDAILNLTQMKTRLWGINFVVFVEDFSINITYNNNVAAFICFSSSCFVFCNELFVSQWELKNNTGKIIFQDNIFI